MPEQLTLDQRLRQRRAVDRDEGPGNARRKVMQRPRHHFLPASRGPGDQHIRFRRPQRPDHPPQVHDRRRPPRQPRLQIVALPRRRAQPAVLHHQRPMVQRPPQHRTQRLHRKGLFDEIIGPAPHRRHRQRHIGMARDQDHRQVAVDLAHPLHQGHAVHPRHADIRHHHPVQPRRHRPQRLLRACEAAHLMPGKLQPLLGGPAHRRIIVDQKDALPHSAAISRAGAGCSTTSNTAPPPGWLATRRSPPKSFTML